MRYEVRDGKVLTWSLEVHLVDHCNLSCAECCTLSPHLPERFADPSGLARDLALARTALSPALLKLTGGEPLLHPRLGDCLRVARESGIAREVSLTTNGLLLRRAPEALFELVDRITLSAYPSAPISDDALGWVLSRCERAGIVLNFKHASAFQRMTPERPVGDEEHAARVFASCWMKDRCHLLRDGRFFRCTRPPHLEARLRQLGIEVPLADLDGVPLEGEDLAGRILDHLDSGEPLRSCRSCLGNSGPFEPHRQLGTVRA
ncbi:MAG: radical SAM protein [Acidobacteria bacterium]|nr:MAG: radical SAM protein [Acidobacteriota bacterium]MCE7956848.1 radical SAM protein [Acidobacteria bacterium ACB2]